MRVLFVNPYIYDFSAYDLWLRPLGLYYLAAHVREHSDAEIYWLDALDRFQDGMEICGRADGRGKYPREFVEKPGIYQNVPRNYSRYGIPLELFQSKMAALPEMDVILVTSLMTYWLQGLQFTLKLLKQRFSRAKVVLGGVLPSLAPTETRSLLPADHLLVDTVKQPYCAFWKIWGQRCRMLRPLLPILNPLCLPLTWPEPRNMSPC